MASDTESRTRNPTLVIALVACLPLFYVLSLGPVGWLTKRAGIHIDWILPAYAPVAWLRDHTLLRSAIDWYADLWGVH